MQQEASRSIAKRVFLSVNQSSDEEGPSKCPRTQGEKNGKDNTNFEQAES